MSERMTVDAETTLFSYVLNRGYDGSHEGLDAAIAEYRQAILDEGLKEYQARVDVLVEQIRFNAYCRKCGYYETSHRSEMVREACGIDHDFIPPWHEGRVAAALSAVREPQVSEGGAVDA